VGVALFVSFTITALEESLLPRLVALFEAASSSCFCRYWHFTGTKNEWLDRCAHRPEENRAELEAAVRARDPGARALLAFAGEDCVGFMKLVPRATIPKLRMLSVYRQLDLGDETTTYSVGCFLVHPTHRKKGVARALVHAAPDFVRKWGGRAIEAYPRRSSAPLYDEEAWQGPESVFRGAGFEAVHDEGPYPVLRISGLVQD
jgi:GNAT superfamily N-acetyltransferase